jgi:hypothetical protein
MRGVIVRAAAAEGITAANLLGVNLSLERQVLPGLKCKQALKRWRYFEGDRDGVPGLGSHAQDDQLVKCLAV